MKTLLPVAKFAARQGISPARVRKLCAVGRVVGARKVGKVWVVPADAHIIPARFRASGFRVQFPSLAVSTARTARNETPRA